MSYKNRLSELDREAESSLTSQIVDVFAAAIAAGERAPDEKLPPTRALAELAGVNNLTTARAYPRFVDLRLVTARVGQGRFVRVGAALGDGLADGMDRQD